MTRCILLAGALFAATATVRADEPYRQVEEVLSTNRTVVGETLRYPPGAATVHAVVITLRPGEETARHRHGVPLFAYVLEGELTVDYAGHGTRVYRAGDALLEGMDVAHFGRNTGQSRVRILAVFLGAEGRAETVIDTAPRQPRGHREVGARDPAAAMTCRYTATSLCAEVSTR